MYPPDRPTIATEKNKPRDTPNKMAATMVPIATKPAIMRALPKKEKSIRDVKATAVNPANKVRVRIPAVGITIGPAKFAATKSNGRKMIASATTYKDRPAYCIDALVPLRAQRSATHPVPINRPRIINHPYWEPTIN